MQVAKREAGRQARDEPTGPVAPDPLGGLAREHAALLESSRVVAGLITHGPLTDAHVAEVEERMRHLRFLLPRHLVIEERSLYPEVERSDPSSGPSLEAVVGQHRAVEGALARLQAECLALSVDPGSLGKRRRAGRAAKEFHALLEELLAAQEAGPLALAARLLEPASLDRLAQAMEAAAFHDLMKASHHR